MLSKTNIYNAKRLCCEDISLIKNYDKAMADKSETRWDCHHKLGIIRTTKQLKEMGLYYNRPARELIFLTQSEHRYLHNLFISKETSKKLSIKSKQTWDIPGYRERHHNASIGRKAWNKGIKGIGKGIPKPKYYWLTPDGQTKIMAKNMVVRFHKDWILIGPA